MSIKWQIQSVIDQYAYPNTRKCFQRKNFEIVEITSLLLLRSNQFIIIFEFLLCEVPDIYQKGMIFDQNP